MSSVHTSDSSEGGASCVQFRSPNGAYIKFSEEDGFLVEWVFEGGDWQEKGEARRLYYDAAIRHLSDESGRGGILPADEAEHILEKLVKLADMSGVPHNIRFGGDSGGDRSVVFRAPSGDVVRFVGTLHDGVEEFIQTRRGWDLVGLATHFDYDPVRCSLVDQNGAGGVLPSEDLHILLKNIKKLAEYANITHNIRLEPVHRTYPSRRRGLGLEANTSLLIPKIPQRYTYKKHERSERRRSGSSKALLVTVSNGFDNAQRSTDQIRAFFARKHPLTQCNELAARSREDLVKGLEWLVRGSMPGDNLFISIVGMADEYSGMLVAGGFTQHDWKTYLNSVPTGVQITILAETYPACDLVGLPYKASANSFDEGYVFTEGDTFSYRSEAKITMLCTQAVQQCDSRIGMLVEPVLEYLERDPTPTYKTLLQFFKGRLRSTPYLAVAISSNISFDAVKERFSFSRTATLSPSISPLLDSSLADLSFPLQREGSIPSSLHSSELDDALNGTPLNTDNEVRKALFFIYRKVNPSKLHMVERFVKDYKGQYRNLFDLMAKKYNDPSILEAYSPFWGP